MSDWTAKRFWAKAHVTETAGGFGVLLDTRTLMTPFKSPLVVPSQRLATWIAAEWDAQSGRIDPDTMPATRTANSAIDKVAPQRIAVADMLADYGGSDLLCYRAGGPDGLMAAQNAAWNPLLVWATQALDAPLHVTTGVMPVAQPVASLERLHDRVHAFDHFALAGFNDMVSLSGSLIIGFAVASRRIDAETGWRASRVDEDWQAAIWGKDDEASANATLKKQAFLTAWRFFDLVKRG